VFNNNSIVAVDFHTGLVCLVQTQGNPRSNLHGIPEIILEIIKIVEVVSFPVFDFANMFFYEM
jgi:hypothetical protein